MTWMELESIILKERSQSEKDKCHMISLRCEVYETKQMTKGKKRDKPRNKLVTVENKLMATRGNVECGWGLEERKDGVKSALIMIKNKV